MTGQLTRRGPSTAGWRVSREILREGLTPTLTRCKLTERAKLQPGKRASMNWLVSEPVSAESMIQTALPFLLVVGALFAIIAIFTLVVLLHTVLVARSSASHLESHQFGTAQGRVDRSNRDAAPDSSLDPLRPGIIPVRRASS